MCSVMRVLVLSRLRSVRGLTKKTYDEPITFCHRCGLFNDEAKNVKRNYVMDATISTSDPEGGGSARDTRVSLTTVDMVSKLVLMQKSTH